MDIRRTLVSAAVGAVLCGASSFGVAQQGEQQANPQRAQQQGQQQRVQTARAGQGAQGQQSDASFSQGRRIVVGEVTDMRDVSLQGPAGNQHKLIKVTANDSTVIVDLGADAEDVGVENGDRIIAVGNSARINGMPVVYARYIGELYENVPLERQQLTALSQLSEQDAARMAGRDIRLDNLYVTRVPGDVTFFVCSTGGQGQGQRQSAAAEPCTGEEMLVVLLEEEGAGPADVDGRVDINPGQMLTIRQGRVAQFDTSNVQALQLSAQERSLAEDEGIFVVADAVNITSRNQGREQAQAGGQQPSAGQGQSANQQQQGQQQASRQQQRAGRQQAGSSGQSPEIISLDQWDYDELYQGGWSADRLMDADVYSQDGEDIGSVENLLLDDQGQVVAIIAQVGGFLDIGDTHVSVPWSEVNVRAYDEIVVPLNEENIDDYVSANDDYFTQVDLGVLQRVDDDVVTGPQIWKATDLLDDDVLLDEGTGYGYVSDLVFNEQGRLTSIVVNSSNPDFGYGYYAYPWYGAGFGTWEPGLGYYTLPYGPAELGGLGTFDVAGLNPGLF